VGFTDKPHPCLQIYVSFSISDIIDNNHARSAFVVDFTESPIPLLASSIPEWNFYFFGIEFNHLGEKLHSKGGVADLLELVAHKSSRDVGLACARTTNHYYLVHLAFIFHDYYCIGYPTQLRLRTNKLHKFIHLVGNNIICSNLDSKV